MSDSREQSFLRNLLREHPALLVSSVYVLASTIGMVYYWAFLRYFGINVFHYAQVGDFLLASLKEPFTWFLVLLAQVLMVLDNRYSRRIGRKERSKWVRWYGTPRYRSINYVVSLGMVVLFLLAYAHRQAESVLEGSGEYVTVTLADGSAARKALLLGTTGQFLFLFEPESKLVDIHPHENVQAISLQVP